MADTNVTTDAGLSDEMKTYYERVMIEVMRPLLVHLMYAQMGRVIQVPGRSGKVLELRKRNSFDKAGELTEGVTPTGKKLSVTKLEIAMKQFGDFTEVSDVASLTTIDPILEMAAETLGDQAADTIDGEFKEAMNSGTNVQRVNGRLTRGAIVATDKFTGTEARKAVRTLRRNDAKTFNGLFIGFVHPDVEYDLMSDPEFKAYTLSGADAEKRFEGLILGTAFGVLWLRSSACHVYEGEGDGGIDVFSTLICGADALGVAEWMALEFIYHGLGSAGSADPVNQRQTAAWKMANGSKIVQEAHIVRVESAASN